MNKTLLLLVLSMSSLLLTAQPTNPAGDVDNPVPITGLEWLLAGGCALGLKKIIGARKKGD